MTVRVGLIGAGGHGRALVAAARNNGWDLRLYCDPKASEWCTLPHVADESALDLDLCPGLILGLGGVTPAGLRRRLVLLRRLQNRGFRFPPLVHKSAVVDLDAQIGAGAQILAASVVQPGAVIGEGAIVNSGAIIEHECRIGAGAHVAPGAIVLGGSIIGDCAMIGAGAVVLPGAVVPEGRLVLSLTRFPQPKD